MRTPGVEGLRHLQTPSGCVGVGRSLSPIEKQDGDQHCSYTLQLPAAACHVYRRAEVGPRYGGGLRCLACRIQALQLGTDACNGFKEVRLPRLGRETVLRKEAGVA